MKRAHTEEPISSRLPELPAAIAVKRVNADAVYTDNPSSSAAAREVKMKRTHSEVATAEAKENLLVNLWAFKTKRLKVCL